MKNFLCLWLIVAFFLPEGPFAFWWSLAGCLMAMGLLTFEIFVWVAELREIPR
jgi:hypothetical protein